METETGWSSPTSTSSWCLEKGALARSLLRALDPCLLLPLSLTLWSFLSLYLSCSIFPHLSVSLFLLCPCPLSLCPLLFGCLPFISRSLNLFHLPVPLSSSYLSLFSSFSFSVFLSSCKLHLCPHSFSVFKCPPASYVYILSFPFYLSVLASSSVSFCLSACLLPSSSEEFLYIPSQAVFTDLEACHFVVMP